MRPAALGLTCNDALVVFSQNETLRLQAEVSKLKKIVEMWKQKCQRQKKQLAWACRMLHDANVRTGCGYCECETCGVVAAELGVCMCPLQTCQCNACDEDRDITQKNRMRLRGDLDSDLPSPVSPTYDEARVEFVLEKRA